MPPRVTLIRHELLKNADRGGFAFFSPVFNRSGDRWSMRKSDAVGQKGAEFEIRIDAGLRPAEDFQDQFVAKHDGRVALLASHGGDLEIRYRAQASIPHGAHRRSNKITLCSAQMTTARDHID